jgi:Tfp pilus assembly protein PilO
MAVKRNLISSSLTKAAMVLIASCLLVIGMGVVYANQITRYLQVSTKLDQAKVDIERLDNALEEFRANESRIETISASLPQTHEHYAQVLRVIEAEATENKLELGLKLDPEAIAESPSLTSLKIIMEIKGNYQNVAGFVAAMANLPFHTRIDELSMSGQPAPGATITMRLYGQPEIK